MLPLLEHCLTVISYSSLFVQCTPNCQFVHWIFLVVVANNSAQAFYAAISRHNFIFYKILFIIFLRYCCNFIFNINNNRFFNFRINHYWLITKKEYVPIAIQICRMTNPDYIFILYIVTTYRSSALPTNEFHISSLRHQFIVFLE